MACSRLGSSNHCSGIVVSAFLLSLTLTKTHFVFGAVGLILQGSMMYQSEYPYSVRTAWIVCRLTEYSIGLNFRGHFSLKLLVHRNESNIKARMMPFIAALGARIEGGNNLGAGTALVSPRLACGFSSLGLFRETLGTIV